MQTMMLNVGESMHLKKGFMTKKELIFTGMPDDRCFSIAYFWTSGYNSAAYNLFFPVSRSEIEIAGRRFAVIQVNPEQMQIQPLERV